MGKNVPTYGEKIPRAGKNFRTGSTWSAGGGQRVEDCSPRSVRAGGLAGPGRCGARQSGQNVGRGRRQGGGPLRFPPTGIRRVCAGGQNALAALLFHGDFYKAAVASCGCHDNRMDKIWWNEQWMGYPVDSSYVRSSNVANAHRLRGDLLLINGELDDNVDPASTLQVVDALVRAGKMFEQLYLPGKNHNLGGRYEVRRMYDFFVRKLRDGGGH